MPSTTQSTTQSRRRSETIKPLIYNKVVVLREDATVYDASRAMHERGIGSVIVSDGKGHVTGVLTDRDLACAIARPGYSSDLKIGELMSKNPVVVEESASLDDVVALMRERGIRRLPVVQALKKSRGEAERCIGLISLDDLIVARLVGIDDLSDIIKPQILGRTKELPRWREADLHSNEKAEELLKILATSLEINESLALSLLKLVAGLVIRRVHFTKAAALIAHIPERMQSELLDLPAGPDEAITAEQIVQEVVARFDVDDAKARAFLAAIGVALECVAPLTVVAEVAEALPDDVRELMLPLAVGGHRSPL